MEQRSAEQANGTGGSESFAESNEECQNACISQFKRAQSMPFGRTSHSEMEAATTAFEVFEQFSREERDDYRPDESELAGGARSTFAGADTTGERGADSRYSGREEWQEGTQVETYPGPSWHPKEKQSEPQASQCSARDTQQHQQPRIFVPGKKPHQQQRTPSTGNQGGLPGRTSAAAFCWGPAGTIVVIPPATYGSSAIGRFVSVHSLLEKGTEAGREHLMELRESWSELQGGTTQQIVQGIRTGQSQQVAEIERWLNDQANRLSPNESGMSRALVALCKAKQQRGNFAGHLAASLGVGDDTGAGSYSPAREDTQKAWNAERLLVRGEKENALKELMAANAWAPALILARSLGDGEFQRVAKGAAMALCGHGSPFQAALTAPGDSPNKHPGFDIFEGPGSAALGRWRETLCALASVNSYQGMISLGDALWQNGHGVACAHTCYLSAGLMPQPLVHVGGGVHVPRVCLLGADHVGWRRTFVTPLAVRRTMVLEKLHGKAIMPLQPYKLALAGMLADSGMVHQALNVVEALEKCLPQPPGPPDVNVNLLLRLTKSFQTRLSGAQSLSLVNGNGGGAKRERLGGTSLMGRLEGFVSSLFGDEGSGRGSEETPPAGSSAGYPQEGTMHPSASAPSHLNEAPPFVQSSSGSGNRHRRTVSGGGYSDLSDDGSASGLEQSNQKRGRLSGISRRLSGIMSVAGASKQDEQTK